MQPRKSPEHTANKEKSERQGESIPGGIGSSPGVLGEECRRISGEKISRAIRYFRSQRPPPKKK